MRTLKITAAALIALGILVFTLRGSTASIEYGNGFARDVAAKTIVADRDKTIAQLEEVVKRDVGDPNKQEAAKSAMILLGQLRADDAAPLLASHVSFRLIEERWKKALLQPLTPMQVFPAVGALIQIGVPAVDALVYQASQTDNRKDDPLTNFVLDEVLGKQPAIAFVQDAIQAQREPEPRRRLNALLTSLRKEPGGPRRNSYM